MLFQRQLETLEALIYRNGTRFAIGKRWCLSPLTTSNTLYEWKGYDRDFSSFIPAKSWVTEWSRFGIGTGCPATSRAGPRQHQAAPLQRAANKLGIFWRGRCLFSKLPAIGGRAKSWQKIHQLTSKVRDVPTMADISCWFTLWHQDLQTAKVWGLPSPAEPW